MTVFQAEMVLLHSPSRCQNLGRQYGLSCLALCTTALKVDSSHNGYEYLYFCYYRNYAGAEPKRSRTNSRSENRKESRRRRTQINHARTLSSVHPRANEEQDPRKYLSTHVHGPPMSLPESPLSVRHPALFAHLPVESIDGGVARPLRGRKRRVHA